MWLVFLKMTLFEFGLRRAVLRRRGMDEWKDGAGIVD